MDDIEIDLLECPQCGEQLYRQDCPTIGCDDGYIDMHEYDDPLWYDEGEYEQCQECGGWGFVRWCRKCGYDWNERN